MQFSPDLESVSAARHFVREALAEWDRPEELGIVVLLVSEVTSNAIVHGSYGHPGATVVVALSRVANVVRVGVTDQGTNLPVIGDGDPDKSSGRGLILLDALATAWGVVPNGTGKLVWFEVEG